MWVSRPQGASRTSSRWRCSGKKSNSAARSPSDTKFWNRPGCMAWPRSSVSNTFPVGLTSVMCKTSSNGQSSVEHNTNSPDFSSSWASRTTPSISTRAWSVGPRSRKRPGTRPAISNCRLGFTRTYPEGDPPAVPTRAWPQPEVVVLVDSEPAPLVVVSSSPVLELLVPPDPSLPPEVVGTTGNRQKPSASQVASASQQLESSAHHRPTVPAATHVV